MAHVRHPKPDSGLGVQAKIGRSLGRVIAGLLGVGFGVEGLGFGVWGVGWVQGVVRKM